MALMTRRRPQAVRVPPLRRGVRVTMSSLKTVAIGGAAVVTALMIAATLYGAAIILLGLDLLI